MSTTLEPQKTWYVVQGERFVHVFDDPDDASDFVMAEVLIWNGETREPDTWPYIEEIPESEIQDLQGSVMIHNKESAA